MNLRDFKAEFMMAFGVGNCRVAVILANGSVVDDPKNTPFHVIWRSHTFTRSAPLLPSKQRPKVQLELTSAEM